MRDRRRQAFALGLSLALHGLAVLLLLWFMRHPRPAAPAVKVSLVRLPAMKPLSPPPVPEARPAAPGPIARKRRAKKVAKPAEPPPAPIASAPRPPSLPPDAPRAVPEVPAPAPEPDTGGAPVAESGLGRILTSPEGARVVEQFPELTPGIPGAAGKGPAPSADPHGHTLHNDPSELPDPAAVAEADGQHAKAKLDAFIADELASIRVENGLVDPYFVQMRASLEEAARNPPNEKGVSFVQKLARSWLDSARQYGRGGSPYAAGAQPEAPTQGSVQTPLEREAEARPGTSAEGLARTLQQGARLREFADGRFGGGLLAIVEIRQSSDGKYQGAVVLQSSGNRVFDAHVMRSAPLALESLEAPSAGAPGVRPDGIRSTWAFEGRVTYKKKLSDFELQKDWWYLLAMAPASLATGNFDEVTGEVDLVDLRNPQFLCKVKLLRVY